MSRSTLLDSSRAARSGRLTEIARLLNIYEAREREGLSRIGEHFKFGADVVVSQTNGKQAIFGCRRLRRLSERLRERKRDRSQRNEFTELSGLRSEVLWEDRDDYRINDV